MLLLILFRQLHLRLASYFYYLYEISLFLKLIHTFDLVVMYLKINTCLVEVMAKVLLLRKLYSHYFVWNRGMLQDRNQRLFKDLEESYLLSLNYTKYC